ncbi:Uu.00g059010.m01.CDS01 [Anthostomella pinea]|uniref:ATP-dependent DNA helicase II subunit 2 n=1 Tax=Anthostomella pinea TaxID=933095 RepID=A0AAI8VRX1_9PEZI|nr:Uu.00g059010.m01.CDS01 [Anthostomella pinea]
MADKEATVYILDLGSSMADCHNGRLESDLDWSMRYVWDKISTTVAASRKTWNVGVIGVRTDETNNPLTDEGEEGYENISVLQDLGPMTMESLRELQPRIVTSDSESGDSISAIVIAVEMIEILTKKLKYKRKIILVTDAEAPIDGDEFDDIAKRITGCGIELTVLGVDFDDAEFGFKEEDKSSLKKKNERLLKELVDKCDGLYGTMAEAIAELETPRLKTVKPYKTYDGPLTLGNPKEHEDAMSINVERYFKTHKATVPPASRVVVKSEPTNGGPSGADSDGDAMQGVESTSGFAAVKNAFTYKVNDPEAPGGKRDVEREDLAKGYEYGRTAVHISESEYNITKLETTKSFSIIGFIQQEKYEPFLNMGEACVTVAQKSNDAAALKLSSLIHSLHELESYAVARIVAKDGKDPALVLLAPNIEPDFECLYDIPLPFAEDVRNYLFPPLDKVVTIQGTTITEKHRNLPSEELIEAMDDFVDAMDISKWEEDDEGKRTLEYAAVEDVYCPPLHRINQVVRHRAIYPDQPVPPVPAILLEYSQPPGDLVKKVMPELEDLMDKANVKKVPPQTKGKKDKADRVQPISGLDIDALLQQPEHKRTSIDPENSISEFKQMVEAAEDEASVQEAAKQMGIIIRSMITKNTLGDIAYDRAIENLGVFRDAMINYEFPDLYNTFMKDFKKRLLSGELGGDRRELWWQIKGARLGLIDSTASEASKVQPEEATEFYKNASAEVVTIEAPSGRQFAIRARPLAHFSVYFRRALNSRFHEAATRTSRLTEYCDDQTMRMFIIWVSLRSVHQSDQFELVILSEELRYDGFAGAWVKAWLFGDYIQAAPFQNDMLCLLEADRMWKVDADIIRDYWEDLSPSCSNLKNYMLDVFCKNLIEEEDEDARVSELDLLPAEASKEVSKRLATALVDRGEDGEAVYEFTSIYPADYLEDEEE